MSYIFNKERLTNILDINNIKYDFNDPKSIDKALGELAIKKCNHDSFIGAGVYRSTFDIGNGYVMKISKEYYVDEDDETAEEEYFDEYDEDEYGEYDGGGWSFDNIEFASKDNFSDEQSIEEIKNYIKIGLCGRAKRCVYDIYAATSNNAIILAEYCYPLNFSDTNYKISHSLNNIFADIHIDNIRLNKNNKIVITDLGGYQDWELICNHFKVPYNKYKNIFEQ